MTPSLTLVQPSSNPRPTLASPTLHRILIEQCSRTIPRPFAFYAKLAACKPDDLLRLRLESHILAVPTPSPLLLRLGFGQESK